MQPTALHGPLYNVTGWPQTLTMEALLTACRAVSGSDAHFTWVSELFLHAEHVAPWTAMPLPYRWHATH